MSLLSNIFAFFPTIIIGLGLACFISFWFLPIPVGLTGLLFCLYGLPVLIYRLHHRFYPIQEGISYLRGKNYSPWWGSHQIQIIYMAFPALETILRLIPGVFSVWLRLWGSKVGNNVYWTPRLAIADRGLLEIGDNVIFGYQIAISSHVIKPKKQDLRLYVKKVKIGNNVFISANCNLGPGVTIQDGSYIPLATTLYPNQQQ